MTTKHFEHLWEEAENCHSLYISKSDINSIINEIELKLNLYKSIDNSAIPAEDKEKTKSHLFGEILLSITQLTLKDNINSYKALKEAIFHKNIDIFSKKY